ncbi:MAG TPA: nucleotidyltransferase domain-containing protein [Polyangiaceae bacterium]|nr:nucleotidyltransferase domain-containing protein [Polyangiaceae bacterium]
MATTKTVDELFPPRANMPWLRARTLLLTRHGSHAYGLNTPTSDEDYKGVAVPPREYFLGFANAFDQAESSEPDLVVYEVRKFFRLARDCNPNLIEVLYTDPSDHLLCTPVGERLLAGRDLFLSRKARHTFSGYAIAQLKRLSSHQRWLREPPSPPRREDFGLPPAADAEPAAELGEAERAYRARKHEWDAYQNWLATRNQARAELEARYGYDVKHAMHVVRLLRMCREILESGRVVVKRPDRDELLAVRSGAWPYERLVEWASEQDRAMAELSERSPLPRAPDAKALDALCVSVVEAALAAG